MRNDLQVHSPPEFIFPRHVPSLVFVLQTKIKLEKANDLLEEHEGKLGFNLWAAWRHRDKNS